MALTIFIFLPLGWFLTGRLLGWAISLTVPAERGERFGFRFGWWFALVSPVLYWALLGLGASGNAGHGVRLFGSEEAFGLLCLPLYLVPGLCLVGGMLYVIRDLARGLPRSSAKHPGSSE
jgi:hypothetical protein